MDAAVSPANVEAVEAWDGPLFERFVRYRHIVVEGLANYGDEAMRLHPPARSERVLDIGCGFGDTTQQLAALVGPDGSATGVDAASRFIEAARREAAGVENVDFLVADVETGGLGEGYTYAFSRMGTMFFANPVRALRNVRSALAPEGRLVMVVWRSKEENDWMYRPQLITERFVTKPEESDEPTCGPGPFSMGNADTVSGILVSAGFEGITLRRCDLPIWMGADLAEAAEFVMALGPAGEILRLLGERAAGMTPAVTEALQDGMRDWLGPDGVVAPASGWIVTAEAGG